MSRSLASCLASLLLVAGCFSGNRRNDLGPGQDGGDLGSDAGPGGLGGVPCDVSAILEGHCIRCHNGRPLAASKVPLTRYADLLAPAPDHESQTVAERALVRMRDPDDPMPPHPEAPLGADEVQTFSDWLSAGAPEGSCADGDAGLLEVDAGPGPYDTPTVCTSDSYWTRGNHESPLMRPGGACIDCHTEEREGPRYSIAGTVYASAHEPNDCNGLSDGVTVVITDANGAEIHLTPNEVGNFDSGRTRIPMPYRAKVLRDGLEREMHAEQTNGDCNHCHTETGIEDAPGRIMAP